MTPRRRAEDFARALEDGTADPGAASVLARLEAARQELEQDTAPRPEFRDALRTRLLAVTAVTPQEEPAPRRVRGLRRPAATARRPLVLAGAMAAVVLLAVLVVNAAQGALPGQLLYGTKLRVEAVRVEYRGVTGGDFRKGVAQLQRATTRLQEVDALSQGRGSLGLPSGLRPGGLAAASAVDVDRITTTLEKMDRETRSGGTLAQEAIQKNKDSAQAAELKSWSGGQADTLQRVVAALPPDARQRAEQSQGIVATVADNAARLLQPGCLDSPEVTTVDPSCEKLEPLLPTPGSTSLPAPPAGPTSGGSSGTGTGTATDPGAAVPGTGPGQDAGQGDAVVPAPGGTPGAGSQVVVPPAVPSPAPSAPPAAQGAPAGPPQDVVVPPAEEPVTDTPVSDDPPPQEPAPSDPPTADPDGGLTPADPDPQTPGSEVTPDDPSSTDEGPTGDVRVDDPSPADPPATYDPPAATDLPLDDGTTAAS